MAGEVCKWCGLTVEQHDVRRVGLPSGYERSLVCADGVTKFEAAYFPRAGLRGWQGQTQARQAQERFKMLNELKSASLAAMSIEQLLACRVLGEQMWDAAVRGGYTTSVTWLQDRLQAIDRELQRKRTDDLESELKSLQAEADALKTQEEKRTEVGGRIRDLMRALGRDK